MGSLRDFLIDVGRNAYGLGENVASLGSAAIAEPVAGYAAMFDPVNGAQAIREGMTYQPRTEAGRMYQQGAAQAVGKAIKPVIPVVDTWQKGVDIAGRYSPTLGALMQTAPTALGVALGAKPTLQAGRQASNTLGAMQARMIANANAPKTLNNGFMGQRGIFAGINALTADKDALAKAQTMIAQGVDPEDVWKETGWGRGADGKWRFEIDDSKAKIRDYQFTPRDAYEQARIDAFINESELMRDRAASMKQYAGMTKTQLKEEYKRTGDEIINAALSGDIQKAKKLSEDRNGLDSLLSQMSNRQYGSLSSFMAHGDLGKAYPEVYKIHTRISPDDVGTANAHYNRGSDTQGEQIVMAKKPFFDSDKSTMLHELQHAIQQREGFARGGSPKQFRGISKNPYDAYKKLAGEVEARMVQNRMHLTPEQRRDIYPFAIGRYGYEDIPKTDQLIVFGNNKSMSQRPLTEFEQAHLIAQQNAALPVSQGGLGLAPDNTAMDRARAMGFDVDNPMYHGTNQDINEFLTSGKGKTTNSGAFFTDNPSVASTYSDSKTGVLYPVLLKNGEVVNVEANGSNWNWLKKNIKITSEKTKERKAINKNLGKLFADDFKYNDALSTDDLAAWAKSQGFDSIKFNQVKDRGPQGVFANEQSSLPSNNAAIFNPQNIRSRFAAFDPMKKESSNLLATSAAIAPTATMAAYLYNQERNKGGKQ